MSLYFTTNFVAALPFFSPLVDDGILKYKKMMSGIIPIESFKASTAANNMEITNYNELVEEKTEKCYKGTDIPRSYLKPWRVESGSINFIPGGYRSGSETKFHYNGTGLGLGVPRWSGPVYSPRRGYPSSYA
ncbi:hypothetical protein M9H77_35231 [Catharanthus roseus]|uniref:Uncharacterized protein n=1 Tax=Catharanthus roseus TaxID=4058 RepID=A0ACB9ZR09_CATRO|nr:hypothetical protein M9H77_35231 [Catharanthus roseus]